MANHSINKIKLRRSYSITEIASLLVVDRKTCHRWIKYEGLRVIEKDVSPVLVMGADLENFIKSQRAKRKIPIKEDEFFCMKCHKAVRAKLGSGKTIKTGKKIGRDNHEQLKKIGVCEICQTQLHKYLGVSQRD